MDVCLSFSSDQNFRGHTHTHLQMRFGGQRAERPAIVLKKIGQSECMQLTVIFLQSALRLLESVQSFSSLYLSGDDYTEAVSITN